MKTYLHVVLLVLGFAGALFISSCGQTTTKATTNIHGIDPANFDTTVAPCTDFYEYANGTWLKNNPIPAEYSSWSISHEIYERNTAIIRTILEESAANTSAPKGTVEQQIGDFYYSAMDTMNLEKLGFEPLKKDFQMVDAIASTEQLQDAIALNQTRGISSLFDIGSDQDMMDNTKVILYATQGGLSLPDRDYYTRDDSESVKLREQFVEHVGNMFKLTGVDAATANHYGQTVLALETRLAKASLTSVELRNPMSWYNIQTIAQASKQTPNFGWNRYLKNVGLDKVESFSFAQPKFFKEMNNMIKDLPLDQWKVYLKWHILTSAADCLSSDFDKEDFHFYSTILYGTEEMRARWKRISSKANRLLGEAVGQLYVKKAFPAASKERALTMVRNLQASLKDRIEKLAWMTDATKEKALEKLAAMTPKIGYPDKWIDYSTLAVNRDSYLDNIRAARAFGVHRDLDKIGKPVDNTEWGMAPQTVNAYYNPLKNEIVFPAGILQPPLFDGTIDDAINYGAMGAIIGHEMTHGFDDEGRKFDAIGNYNDWWTEQDAEAFRASTAKIVAQFNEFIAVDSLHVNGELTLGENIADLGGITVAYYALQKALDGKPEKQIDGFTQDQRFFLSFAQAWRTNDRPEALKVQVQTDPHSPANFRVIGPLSNMPEFKKAFGCSDGDEMVRSGDDQVSIW